MALKTVSPHLFTTNIDTSPTWSGIPWQSRVDNHLFGVWGVWGGRDAKYSTSVHTEWLMLLFMAVRYWYFHT